MTISEIIDLSSQLENTFFPDDSIVRSYIPDGIKDFYLGIIALGSLIRIELTQRLIELEKEKMKSQIVLF